MQQGINYNVVPWAELTREANPRRSTDASQGMSFKIVRRGKKFRKSSLDPDATGGAAPPTTAHRYMRLSYSTTDLQYRKTNRRLNRVISRIGDGEALASLPLITNLPTTKNEGNQREPVIADPIFQVRTRCRAMWIGRNAL